MLRPTSQSQYSRISYHDYELKLLKELSTCDYVTEGDRRECQRLLKIHQRYDSVGGWDDWYLQNHIIDPYWAWWYEKNPSNVIF